MKNIKKFLVSFLAIVVLVTGTVLNIEANGISGIELEVYENTTCNNEINEALLNRGNEILEQLNSNARYIVQLLDVDLLVQGDSRWASIEIGRDIVNGKEEIYTMSNSGCCITSFAMIRNFLSGTDETPATIFQTMGAAACPFNYTTAANTYNYDIITSVSNNSGISTDTANSTIIGAISSYSVPVLVGLKSSSTTHFVVACGYNSAGGILIRDPAGGRYTLLSQYLDSGYYVYRIYVYDNK